MWKEVNKKSVKEVILGSFFIILRSFYGTILHHLKLNRAETKKITKLSIDFLITIVFIWLIPFLIIGDIFLLLFVPSLHIFKPLFKAGWKYGLVTAIGVTLAVSIISQYVFFIYSYQYQAFDLYIKDEPKTFMQVQIDSAHIDYSYAQPYLIDRIASKTIEEMNVTGNFLDQDIFFKRGTFTQTADPITNKTYLPNLPFYGVGNKLALFLSQHLVSGDFPKNSHEAIAVLSNNYYRHSSIRVNSRINIYIAVGLSKDSSLNVAAARTYLDITGIVIIDNLTNVAITADSKSIPLKDILGLDQGGAVITSWALGARTLKDIQLTYGFASVFENLFFNVKTIDTFHLNAEIDKLKLLALKLEENYYRLGGYTSVDINSYLIDLLEAFQDEYNLYQIFMFSFLAPLIILTLILTIYAANLVRKKREKQLTILSERGTTKIEIGSYLALESLIFGFIALIFGILLAIPVSALLTKSSGFLSFSNPVVSLKIRPDSVLQALLGSVITIIVIQIVNVITLLKRRTVEDYGKVEKDLPSFYRYYVDIILLIIGGVLWAIYKAPILSGVKEQTTKIIGIPAMFSVLFGSVLLIQRLLPIFSKLLLKLLNTKSNKIRKKLKFDIASIGIKEITRYKASFIRSSIILSLSFAIVISAIVVPATYQRFNIESAYYDLGSDIVISNFPIDNDYVIQAINNVSGVASTSIVRYATLTDVSGDYVITNLILGVDPKTFAQTAFYRSDFSSQSLEEMMSLLTKENFILAQSNTLSSLKKTIGDTVSLGYRGYNETLREKQGSPLFHANVSLKIVGEFKFWPVLVQSVSTGNAREILNQFIANISLISKLQLAPFDVKNYLFIHADSNTDINKLTEEIASVAGSAVSNINEHIFIQRGTARSSILYSAINSTLIMAFTINAIIVTLFASIQLLDRSREIATMKAIGVSRSQLLVLFLAQYLVLLLFSMTMGILSGTFVSWMLMHIITVNRTIPPFIMVIPLALIALTTTILVVTAFFGALLPSLTAANKDIGPELRQSS